jgi:hypothetical protein
MSDLSDDGTSTRGPRRRPRRQVLILTLVTAALAGLAAACGSTAPAAAARPAAPTTYQQILAYVQCIRGHGYPTEPDPNPGPPGIASAPGPPPGPLPPTLRAAQQACQKLAPPYQENNPAVRAGQVAQAEKFSQCMRAHGIARFPDATCGGNFIGINTAGLAITSPQYLTAMQACNRIVPGVFGGDQ